MKNNLKIINLNNQAYLYYSKAGKIVRIPTGYKCTGKTNKPIFERDEDGNNVQMIFNNFDTEIRTYHNENNEFPSVDWIKEKKGIIKNRNKDKDINSIYKEFIHSKEEYVSENTIYYLQFVGLLLRKYNDEKKIDLNNIDDSFINKLLNYIISTHTNNTSNTIFIFIRQFIQFGIKNNFIKYHFINWKEYNKKIRPYKQPRETLTLDELDFLIKKMKEGKGHKNVLNSFIFQSLTSIRHCDLIRLNRTHIVDNKIIITAQKTKRKTGDKIVIDLNDLLLEILENMNYNFAVLTLSNYNIQVKKILKSYVDEMPSFGRKVYITSFRGFKEEVKEKYRYNCFATHSGRRTMITNSKLKNIPDSLIQRQTGHRTLSSLNGYNNKYQESNTNIANILLRK